MISLVIDSNIFFFGIYNEKGLERKILDLSIEEEKIQIFAPDIFWEEVKRILYRKLGYEEEEIDHSFLNLILSKFLRVSMKNLWIKQKGLYLMKTT